MGSGNAGKFFGLGILIAVLLVALVGIEVLRMTGVIPTRTSPSAAATAASAPSAPSASQPPSAPASAQSPSNSASINASNSLSKPPSASVSQSEDLTTLASSRILNAAELSRYSKHDLDVIRNAPYARHGYIFHRADLTRYFTQYNWYNPVVDTEQEAQDQFTKTESANVALIRSIQSSAQTASRSAASVDLTSLASTRRLTEKELRQYSDWQLDIIRNSPYARHGYIFQRDDLDHYFSSYDWYNPTTRDQQAVESRFSRLEKANTALALSVQDRRPDDRLE